MPPWGRPSWGRDGGSRRNRKEWERQQREGNVNHRIEELDSDSGSDIGDGADVDYGQDYSDWEALDWDADFDDGNDMQVAIRDKERILVSRAMTRIRRAQELGRDNVKLSQAESEALERKMAKDRAKGRKAIVDRERIPAQKGRQSLPAPSSKKRGSRSSLNQEEQHTDRPRSRTTSTQNLQQLQVFRRRPPPDESDRRPRSSSGAQPLPYPVYPQDDYAYRNAHHQPSYRGGPTRYVSGPAELMHTRPGPYPTHIPNRRPYESVSDPALDRRIPTYPSGSNRRRDLNSADEDGFDYDEEFVDDQDREFQIDVVPNSSMQGYDIVSRGQGSEVRASQSGSIGRRRGARR